ncbi:hypothetical protein LUCX_62 [Xanthomonas phage vB_XciM_LucasX]|nr:hypothetical protein LUCX_62 [Xanthomonas phage vB_XciM_LucasX]
MSEKNFTRALALSLNNLLPMAKTTLEVMDNQIEHADAHASRLEHEVGDKAAAEDVRQSQATDVISHRAAVRRIHRAETLLAQFNETEQHVKDLEEDHFDGEFEIKFPE